MGGRGKTVDSIPKFTINLKDQPLNLFPEPLIMGVVNVTPDSFSDGGKFFESQNAVEHGLKLIEEGADILDIGGESSRPGAEPVSIKEEIYRVVPVIEVIRSQSNIPISVDTVKPQVAEETIAVGANILNDISGLTGNLALARLAAKEKIPLILMHMRGTPQTMQKETKYEDIITEIMDFLKKSAEKAQKEGVKDIILDPGFGFGKSVDGNLLILKRLEELHSLGYPILIGTSRKSTIGKVLGDRPVAEREFGTAATVAISALKGAQIIRVHNVKGMKDVVKMIRAIQNST